MPYTYIASILGIAEVPDTSIRYYPGRRPHADPLTHAVQPAAAGFAIKDSQISHHFSIAIDNQQPGFDLVDTAFVQRKPAKASERYLGPQHTQHNPTHSMVPKPSSAS
ncbi:hypothetical protein [Arthrobacter zhaoguopingii]|uniref:hypothetical protein n=1 Tax=Arthrobacter zhaoguopingii TaxID=2681491 RepID=UPI00135CBC41|nr:hypothetical protein [Arthrobacter zhaoguopingii]